MIWIEKYRGNMKNVNANRDGIITAIISCEWATNNKTKQHCQGGIVNLLKENDASR